MEVLGALFRQIVEGSPDGIWVFDEQGRTTYANPRAAEMLGRTAEEMAGLSVYETLDDVGQRQFAIHLAEMRAGVHNDGEVECKLLRKDGSRLLAMVRDSPLYNEAGELVGFMHRLVDRTGRRELVEELRHSREQLEVAQTIARTGSWELDLRTGEVLWSDHMYSILGVDRDTYTPTRESLLDLVADEDRERVNEAVRVALEETGVCEYDARVRLGDTAIWIHGRGVVAYDERGEPLRIGGTAQDITEAKELELQLVDAVILNAMMQAMASAANESETLEEALGVAQDQLLAHDDWSRAIAFRPVPGEDRLEPMAVGRPLAAVPVPEPVETDLAERVWRAREPLFEERAQPQTPSLGFPLMLGEETVAVVVITTASPFERHAMLRSMAEQVSVQLSRVAERERTDAEQVRAAAELEAARDAAMEASRLKSEFLAMMSHEIRTPLNGVIGLNDLLLRSRLTDDQRRLAEGVQGSGRALLAIVNDVLDFSKIEAGRLELEHVDFEVRAVFDQVVGFVAETARAKGLELVVAVHPDVPEHLAGDPTRLSQVLTNLVANAVKFTAAGEVVVRCTVARDDGATVVLEVTVTDTGIGIERDRQGSLFEPFVQADASTTRTFGGTGLGLAISRQLVAAIGGDIGVTSEVGVGSTFWFTGRFEHATSSAPPVGDHPLDRRRALVVCDIAGSRQLLAETLAGWGMCVDATGDPADGLARLAGRPVDVVLLDLAMPGRDPLATAAEIRRRTDPPAVVLLCAHEPDPEAARSAGVAGVLHKPVSRSTLFDRLVTCVAAAHGLAGFRPATSPRARHGRHVLVVEDNDVNQLVALGVLEALGYTADVAPDGVAGVELARRNRYDAVLMDVQMPRMDGYGATRAIRALPDPARAGVPIVAMTAAAFEAERERCLAVGMDEFLTKPIDPRRLEDTLDRILAGAPPARSPRPSAPAVSPARGDGPVDLDPGRLDELLEMGDGAEALVRRAVDNFVAGAPEALAEIRSAADRGDAAALRAAAHRLKGSAQNLGAVAVGELGLELELLADGGTTDGAAALVARLDVALARAVTALRNHG